MKSGIKIFREDYSGGRIGQLIDEVHSELDKCETKMLRRFDAWRKGKKIISALPKRICSDDIDGNHYVILTVLYES